MEEELFIGSTDYETIKNINMETTELIIKEESGPYTCPVCNGNGLVPNGFYTQTSGQWGSTDATPEKCRSCNGTGIVWKPSCGCRS